MHQIGLLFVTKEPWIGFLFFARKQPKLSMPMFTHIEVHKSERKHDHVLHKYKNICSIGNDRGYTFRTNHANIWASELAKHSEKKCFIMKNEPIFSFQQRIRRHNNYRLSQTQLSYSYFCWIAYDKKGNSFRCWCSILQMSRCFLPSVNILFQSM